MSSTVHVLLFLVLASPGLLADNNDTYSSGDVPTFNDSSVNDSMNLDDEFIINSITLPVPVASSSVPVSLSSVPAPESSSSVPLPVAESSSVPISSSNVPVPESSSSVPVPSSSVPESSSSVPVPSSSVPESSSSVPESSSSVPESSSSVPESSSSVPESSSSVPESSSSVPESSSSVPVSSSSVPVSSSSVPVSSSVITSTTSTTNPPATQPTSPPTSSESTEEPTNPLTPTEPPGESKESIASISIFFILVLLAVSVIMVHLFIKYEFHYLPESIALVLLGFIVGGILFILNLFGYDYQYQETFSPQFFFLVLLPPIIFESGYSLHKGNFFQNLGSIMMFAVFGTAISAVIVGGGVYLLGLMGVVYKLDLIQSFTFGSLISAVDPVATLAIFHALHVDPTLNMLVFGESVLNDAVSIVLTKTILNQLPPSGNVTAVEASAAQVLGNSSWQFCVMFFGSALLGVAFALISALFLKLVNLRRHQSLEFSMWVIFAFAPYFLAEGLHLSGIMAVLFCGIVMSHYTHYNLSAVTQITVQQSLRTVAFMAESGVFLYLGMAVFSINKSFDLALIIWSIVLILIGRAANIFPLTFLMNCCRSVKISLRMQCIMWYSGLRGAVAFALAENLREYFDDKVTGYIVTTTLIIVLFTIVILGGSTLPLLKFLKADKGAKLTLSKTEEQDLAISRATIEETFTKSSYRRLKDCSQGFMYMDYNYIRPLFIRRFTREEVKASQYEMQQKTVEWYRGLREASQSDDDIVIEEGGSGSSSTTSTFIS